MTAQEALSLLNDMEFDKNYQGVQKITDKTEYGDGRFAITIFDRRIFVTSCFEYVKDVEKEKYYVKMGKWVGEEDE